MQKIAICSLSEFTYVAEMIDAAERLALAYEVRYFLGYRSAASTALLEERGIAYEVMLDERPDLAWPVEVGSTFELFTDFFFRQAELVLPRLTERLEKWDPDLVLAHVRDYAGMSAAEIGKTTLVSFGSYACPVRCERSDPPFGAGISRDAPEAKRALMWKFHREFNERVDAEWNRLLRRPYGLEEGVGASTMVSESLVLLSMIPSLSNMNSEAPPQVRFVGRLFSRKERPVADEERILLERIAVSPRPRVLLCLGTTYGGELTERALSALKAFSGTIVVAGGRGAVFGPNQLGGAFIRELDSVIDLVDGVVTVCGGKMVLDVLNRGRPMICLPQQGEQREMALGLVARGAGELPCVRKWDADGFLRAVEAVCSGDGYAKAARELGDEVRAAGGAAEAVSQIEKLLLRGAVG